MPQMAPISWLILFLFFTMIFILFNSINYFCFLNNFKFFDKNNNQKKFYNYNNNLIKNWKW